MKVLDRYYKKIYKYTNKLLNKIFDSNVEDSMLEMNKIKKEIEEKIKKPIEEITTEDLIIHKLSFRYCKYRTMDKILSVLSGALFLKSFYEDDIEEIKNED